MKQLLKIGVIALGGVLIASSISINLSTNLLQTLDPYGVTKQYSLFGSTYDIRLGDELGSPQSVQRTVNTLETATARDTVVFHIVGYGGDVDGLVNLINAIKLSKAHVVMSLEGPAYSAYAVLATQGDELKVSPHSLLMFHTSSLVNYDCAKQTGKDRGVSNKAHCRAYYNANMALWYRLLVTIKLLTPFERQRVMSGHDVYLTSDQIKARGLEGKPSPVENAQALNQELTAADIGLLITTSQNDLPLGYGVLK